MRMTDAPNAKILGILPARWGSTRFPGKPLHLIAGKPLIQHVWDRCSLCKNLDTIVVATDDERIADCVKSFGGQVTLTSADHPSGTDRIAEAAQQWPEHTHIINIQGDEPLISPELIDELAQTLIDQPACKMVTAANPINFDDAEFNDPNVVKVILDRQSNALYFSRSPLPFPRNPPAGNDSPLALQVLRHKGIYGFTREFLFQFVKWQPSPLEMCEQLEQLRALENGAKINVIITSDDSPGIDTPEQAYILNRHVLKKGNTFV